MMKLTPPINDSIANYLAKNPQIADFFLSAIAHENMILGDNKTENLRFLTQQEVNNPSLHRLIGHITRAIIADDDFFYTAVCERDNEINLRERINQKEEYEKLKIEIKKLKIETRKNKSETKKILKAKIAQGHS
jgi:hypothetical protein